jgi:hypothetical protein
MRDIDKGWSWIIDPSCYNYERSKDYTDTVFLEMEEIVNNLGDNLVNANSLTINSGKNYPFKSITREGILSEPNRQLNEAILDIKIEGALPGRYYRLAYLKNGYQGLGVYDYGINLIEFAEGDTLELRVIDYTHPAPDLVLDSIQTQTIKSTVRPELSISITFDTSKLPPKGTNINLMRDIDKGWSWIIDPSCYLYNAPKSGIFYDIKNNKDVSVTYNSDSFIYRLTFGMNGFNALPNIKKIERATATKPQTWVVISETDTDYLPPITVRAIDNGDGVESNYYTGGNHGSNGSSGGSQTARNILYAIDIDGTEVNEHNKKGYAEKINLKIVNEIMAYNTITLDRYVVRQSFKVTLQSKQILVNSDITALEDVVVTTDNGLQLYTGGYQGSMLILGGSQLTRIPFSNGFSSGKKYLQPKAFALVLINSFDQLTMWTDRSYEAGDGRYVGNTNAYIRSGSGSNTKFYNAIVANSPTTILAGTGYKWRGGYSIERKQDIQGYDSLFSINNGYTIALDAINYSVID